MDYLINEKELEYERLQNIFKTLSNSYGVEDQFNKIIDDCQKNNNKYVDQDFYPQQQLKNKDICLLKGCEWRRIEDQYQNGLFSNILPESIQQGSLGDCYFIVSLIYASHDKEKVKSLFHPKSSLKYGCALVYFYYLGERIPVIIDTQIPYENQSSKYPIFCRSKNDDDSCWFVLVEKAFAKLCCGYYAIECGETHFGMQILFNQFGCLIPKIKQISPISSNDEAHQNNEQRFDDLYEILVAYKQRNAMICSSIQKQDYNKLKNETGLIENHSYYVLDVNQSHHKKFIKLRNPWGEAVWTGRFSNGSNDWTQEYKDDLKYNENANDGSFWMLFDDYITYFEDLCFSLPNKNNWKTVNVFGRIDGGIDGMNQCSNIPQWSIKFTEKTTVLLFYNLVGPITFHGVYLCKNHGSKVSDNNFIPTKKTSSDSVIDGIIYEVEDYSEPFTFFFARQEVNDKPCYFSISIQSLDKGFIVEKFNDNLVNQPINFTPKPKTNKALTDNDYIDSLMNSQNKTEDSFIKFDFGDSNKSNEMELFAKAKKYLNKHSINYFDIAVISNVKARPCKKYIYVLCDFKVLILKQKRFSEKITIKVKRCLKDINKISLLRNQQIKLQFKNKKKSTKQKILFQNNDPETLVDNLIKHIQKTLTEVELDNIILKNVSVSSFLSECNSHSILMRMNAHLSMKRITLSNNFSNNMKRILFTHSNTFSLEEIRGMKKKYKVLFPCILMDKNINEIDILDPDSIFPLLLNNLECFKNIKHVKIKGDDSKYVRKVVKKIDNLKSISFHDFNIKSSNFISSLMKENRINSVGFDHSIDKKLFNFFVFQSCFKNLDYLRVTKLNDLNFSHYVEFLKNLTTLSLNSCNLDIGNVLEIIISKEMLVLKHLDLSGNNGTGFSNTDSHEISLPQQLQTLFVNNVKWKKNQLKIFMDICCYSNLEKLSINCITFLNSNDGVIDQVNKEMVNHCWNFVFDNLPHQMNSISSLSWDSNEMNNQFKTFLLNSPKLSTVSFCHCNCCNLKYIIDILIDKEIQNVNLKSIIFKDKNFYFEQLNEFLLLIQQMKSLKHIDISNNLFNSQCFNSLVKSLPKSNIQFISFDNSNISSFSELISLYDNISMTNVSISYPIHDILKLNLTENEIVRINQRLNELKEKNSNSNLKYLPEVSYLNLDFVFPQFAPENNDFNKGTFNNSEINEIHKDDSKCNDTNDVAKIDNNENNHNYDDMNGDKDKTNDDDKINMNDDNELNGTVINDIINVNDMNVDNEINDMSSDNKMNYICDENDTNDENCKTDKNKIMFDPNDNNNKKNLDNINCSIKNNNDDDTTNEKKNDSKYKIIPEKDKNKINKNININNNSQNCTKIDINQKQNVSNTQNSESSYYEYSCSYYSESFESSSKNKMMNKKSPKIKPLNKPIFKTKPPIVYKYPTNNNSPKQKRKNWRDPKELIPDTSDSSSSLDSPSFDSSSFDS